MAGDGVDGLRLHVLPRKRRINGGLGPVWEGRWYVHYRLRIGTHEAVQQRIGSRDTMDLEEARAKAREILTIVEDRKLDPREERRRKEEDGRNGYTFAQLLADWLENYAKPNLTSWNQPKDRITKHALPHIGQMAVAEIRPHHINNVLDKLMSAGKGTQANRVRAHLSAVFKWGLSRDCGIEYNPAAATQRPKRRELARTVVYEHADIRALWHALDGAAGKFCPATRLALKLALVTGQRKSEIAAALVSELHLMGERPFWKLPKERTKGAREHIVPLSPIAVALFREALTSLGREDRQYVFPATGNTSKTPHLAARSLSQAVARSRDAIGLASGQTVHDLRRTVNTEMTRLGISAEVRARIVNHAKKGVTDGVYNVWTYEPEKREAMDKWSRELLRIVRLAEASTPRYLLPASTEDIQNLETT